MDIKNKNQEMIRKIIFFVFPFLIMFGLIADAMAQVQISATRPAAMPIIIMIPAEAPAEQSICRPEGACPLQSRNVLVAPAASLPIETSIGEPITELDPEEVAYLAYSIWGEAGVVKSTTQRAAIAWVILNRVDDTVSEMRRYSSIKEVVTAPDQVQGYWKHLGEPIPGEYTNLAADVLTRWHAEKGGASPAEAGRVIPSTYLFWKGNHVDENFFTEIFTEGSLDLAMSLAWDWSWPSPYSN